MLHTSHGWIFVALMIIVALAAVWADGWLRRRALARGGTPGRWIPYGLSADVLVLYALLRIQPARMGGDPFHFVLGVFDGVVLMTIVMLFVVDHARRVHPPAERGAKLGSD